MKLSPRATSLWIAAAVWMALTAFYIAMGFVEDSWLSYQGISAEYQSYPGNLVIVFSSMSAAEIAVLLLLARPWTFRGLWWRLLVTLLLFSLWTTIWVFGLLHQPPVEGAHLVWLLALVPILLVATIEVSVATLIRARHSQAGAANAGGGR